MSAAFFILAINVCVAGIFATAFAVVAVTTRAAISARWLSAAYGMGALYAVLEFILPLHGPMPVRSVAVFTAFLLAEGLMVIGLAWHYNVPPPWRVLLGLVLVSILINVAILDMPRPSLVRALLYQGPYAAMQVIAVVVMLAAPPARRGALDLLLLSLYTIGAMQFLGKAVLSSVLGPGATEQDYVTTTYAAISQASGAVLLVAHGLLLLLLLVRASMDEMTTRSETDTLSGLLNRRGFEGRAEKMLVRAHRIGLPMTLLVADLDHFKSINDNHGHAVGDRVIAAFAKVFKTAVDHRSVLGRLGGEEFAVLVPASTLVSAQALGHGIRQEFSALSGALTPGQRLSVSLGVAQMRSGEGLFELMHRADAALYQAKRTGRDRVCVASGPDSPDLPVETEGTLPR
ncbi:GGDEF domain-containing protein [Devosia beringensis]|uniref:GGDEF domain-containing protein n=1 Tax=Devosia beringensis TaxID=2657486 RepID=UPI00186BA6E7|nr:GGDEF domain-containing protein [Devosia beringensis]